MRKIIFSTALLCAVVFNLTAGNEGYEKDGVIYSEEDAAFSASGRFSAGAEFKLGRGFHISIAEELRLRYKEDASRQGLDRLYTSVGISYKPIQYLKIGVGYDFINLWKQKNIYADEEKTIISGVNRYSQMRHRVSFDVTGIYKYQAWQFSLRERVQMTHMVDPYLDSFEEPLNALALKSRFKVSYTARTIPLKPYFAAELRNTLNSVNLDKSGLEKVRKSGEDRLVMLSPSYSDAYVDRIRLEVGTEWLLNSHNRLDFYLLYDYGYEKELKVSANKRYVKSYTGCPSNTVALGIAYTFGM